MPHGDAPFFGRKQASEQVQQGGLATAGLPKHKPVLARLAMDIGKHQAVVAIVGVSQVFGFEHGAVGLQLCNKDKGIRMEGAQEFFGNFAAAQLGGCCRQLSIPREAVRCLRY